MEQGERCQASITKTGSTKPESMIWTQVGSTQRASLLYNLKKL